MSYDADTFNSQTVAVVNVNATGASSQATAGEARTDSRSTRPVRTIAQLAHSTVTARPTMAARSRCARTCWQHVKDNATGGKLGKLNTTQADAKNSSSHGQRRQARGKLTVKPSECYHHDNTSNARTHRRCRDHAVGVARSRSPYTVGQTMTTPTERPRVRRRYEQPGASS